VTKDGLGDKAAKVLHEAYDRILREKVPENIMRLLKELS
jgi:hypothetical protein